MSRVPSDWELEFPRGKPPRHGLVSKCRLMQSFTDRIGGTKHARGEKANSGIRRLLVKGVTPTCISRVPDTLGEADTSP